ncbi:hypothetical protein QR680_009108 [Steinernema hermaphroditum]|uniref:Transcription elongation factor 1 homolog n=1 Tax=Steinernema hermaphroditum TaxID=289476 RepID=A0AA39IJ46_9BILA|nr:hypothetical protein QR680_009108 [Steinernema hermaphroditum]
MGRRKATKKQAQKKSFMEPLDTLFACPFCQHERVCTVKMDYKLNLGFIRCNVCQEDFQTHIHSLSEPIDVYNDWIDACEEANN